MHRKQSLSEIRRSFEVRENVHQEVTRISIAGIRFFLFTIQLTTIATFPLFVLPIFKDDDFVNAEDGESPCNLPCQLHFQFR